MSKEAFDALEQARVELAKAWPVTVTMNAYQWSSLQAAAVKVAEGLQEEDAESVFAAGLLEAVEIIRNAH